MGQRQRWETRPSMKPSLGTQLPSHSVGAPPVASSHWTWTGFCMDFSLYKRITSFVKRSISTSSWQGSLVQSRGFLLSSMVLIPHSATFAVGGSRFTPVYLLQTSRPSALHLACATE